MTFKDQTRMKRRFVIFILLILSVNLAAQELTILHVNDTHSHIDPERSGENEGLGGVIEQAAYIDSVRVADGKENVMLLHAGDFSQGTSYFTELGGDIEIDVLNAMGFDAVCLGNHEFDNGIEELVRRLRNLDVPVVCANYDFTSTPLEEYVKPYVVIEKAGMKIGVIGLLTDVRDVVDVHIAAQLHYQNPAEVTNRYAEYLKDEEGCSLVICLTHLGFEREPYTDVELAEMIKDVNIIVGGHSHTKLKDLKKVKNLYGEDVIIVTDWKWGLQIGKLSVTMTPGILAKEYRKVSQDGGFCQDGSWFPYPDYTDREAWKSMLGDNAAVLIKAGEKYLDFKWEPVPATSYLEFERTGNRKIMETPLSLNRSALNSLMLAELAEGEGRFIDQLINGTWHLAHLPSWVLSAHLYRQKSKRALPDPRECYIDLVSAPIGAQMSVVWHFFHERFDKEDPVISYVIQEAVRTKILDPALDPTKFKQNWWLGFDQKPGAVVNNWNPWCNSDVILCFLLMEKDPQRLEHALRQSARSVDRFLEYVSEDGACEEGPSYWGHAAGKLYDYLKIMYDASEGRFDVFGHKRIKDMGEYMSRSNVQDGWVVNFADAAARQSFDPALVYNYGKAVDSQEMMDFAVYGYAGEKSFKSPKPTIGNDVYRSLESLYAIKSLSDRVSEMNERIGSGVSMDECVRSLRASVPNFVWYPQTEFCYMREGEWFLGIKGGHNNESHNHNDVGTFLLYVDGTPIFADAGVGTYTKQTFGPDRFSIWSMQSDWHNLPIINGSSQVFGAIHRSSAVSATERKNGGRFKLDISGAYMDAAACTSWVRDYVLSGKTLTITDTYQLENRVAPDVENFLVHGKVSLPGETLASGYIVPEGEVVIENGPIAMKISFQKKMNVSVETKELSDPRLTKVWGDSLKRISFTSSPDAPIKGTYSFKISQMN